MLPHNDYVVAGLLLSLSATVLAQREDGANEIVYPNEVNQSFHYLDTVDVAFETDYANPWMYVFCNQSSGLLQGKQARRYSNHVTIFSGSYVNRNHLLLTF